MLPREILIIDDNARFRGAIKHALAGKTHNGDQYEFFEAGSLRKGIALLDSKPDLRVILLDLDLPDGSGTDLLEHIRDHSSKYRVIVLTAHEEHLDSQKE